MKRNFRHLMVVSLGLGLWACMEIKPMTLQKSPISSLDQLSNDKPCQLLPIEQNIVGTWHFETNRSPVGILRKGTVTFDAKKKIIYPDTLFSNYINVGDKSPMAKVVNKVYDSDGTYLYPNGYTGKAFIVDLVIKDGRMEKWPMYVASNECNKIVINQISTYNLSTKLGFTLTR